VLPDSIGIFLPIGWYISLMKHPPKWRESDVIRTFLGDTKPPSAHKMYGFRICWKRGRIADLQAVFQRIRLLEDSTLE
jgi:hypothetical protein